jgi:Helix-turn-helix domain
MDISKMPSNLTKNKQKIPTKSNAYAIMPIFILNDENLSDGAKLLYLRLSLYEKHEDWPSTQDLAELQNVSDDWIHVWIQQLAEEHYIVCGSEVRI